MERPEFSEIKDYDEFCKYYWYREELIKICKELGLKANGSKIELNNVIKAYFFGDMILPEKRKSNRSKTTIKELTLSTGFIECGFTFGNRFREFYADQTGVRPFKFNVDMVASAKAVKENGDESFTLGDLLDIYYGKRTYVKYDKSALQWNKFVKDFCADDVTKIYDERLKAAASLWKIVRDSDMKKELRQQRWRVYMVALLSALLLAELLWTIFNAFSWNPEFFFTLGFGVLLFLWAVLVLRKFLRIEKQHSDERIDVDTFHFLRNSSDIHAKRLLNSISLFFGALSVYFGSELSFYIFGNSKPAELFENIFSNIILIQIPLFLLVKNTLMVRMFQKRIGRPEHKRFLCHANSITIFSVLYWAAVTAVVILLREYIFYPANAYLFAGILFALLILLYDLTLRKHVTFRNVVFNKPCAAGPCRRLCLYEPRHLLYAALYQFFACRGT